MFHQYRLSYAFNDVTSPSREAIEIMSLFVDCTNILKEKGLRTQLSGGLQIDHGNHSFDITCTEQFADTLKTLPGIIKAIKL